VIHVCICTYIHTCTICNVFQGQLLGEKDNLFLCLCVHACICMMHMAHFLMFVLRIFVEGTYESVNSCHPC
jgi:hypothetical protein